MKRNIITLLLLLVGIVAKGQPPGDELDILYNFSQVGHSISANWNFNFTEKHTVITGLKYHINRPVIDNRNFAFRHRFYAANAFEALGINLGYERHFKLKESAIEPYFFYLLQGSHSMRARTLVEYCDTVTAVDVNGYTSVVWVASTKTEFSDRLYALEHCFGVGFTARARKNIYLNFSVGGGLVNIWVANTDSFGQRGYVLWWELADVYRAGLTYKFNSSK